MDSKKCNAAMSTSKESTSMQCKLKQLYKQLTIPQAAWMEHSIESPIQDYYVDLNLSSNQVIIHNQLFDDLEVNRILVEGLPGYGKTTLVTKIAYDWASNEQYLQRFDLVFLVTIRDLQQKSVTDAIVVLVDIAGFEQPDEVREKIEKEEDKILLLLDGLDEVPPNVRDKILRILYKREMKEMTVVVTCRSGEFSLDPGESRSLFSGLPIKREFCDKRVTVLGIREEQKTEFLKKFLRETESIEKVIEHLENMTETAQELFDSPLMLILLADMVVRGEPIGPVTSKTRFYKDVVNFMIKRSDERRNIFLSPPIDVFAMKNSKNSKYKILFAKFGLLCFQRVWGGNQLEFDDNELTRNIQKLGLLIVQKKISNTRCKNWYQIYHKTILEFMTAYYIFEDFLRNNLSFSKHIEQKLIEDVVDFGKSSMVTPFLIGLMRDKARHYFNLMSTKYADIFQFNQIALWRMLVECECVDQVENSLILNLPSDLHVNFCSKFANFFSKFAISYSKLTWPNLAYNESLLAKDKDLVHFYFSDLHKRLVKLGTQKGRIKHIVLDPKLRPSLPMDIELPNVSICPDKTQEDYFLQIRPQIACTRCNIYDSWPYALIQFIHNFKILISIPSKLYTLICVNESAIDWMQVKEELGKNILIDLLSYDSKMMNAFYPKNVQKSVFEAICNVLDRFHINRFDVTVENGTDAIKLLSHCRKVNQIYLKCEEKSSISMDDLFLDKQWEIIRLENIKLTPPATKKFYICSSVVLFDKSENPVVLSKISGVSRLGCRASTLRELMRYPSWPNWHTLKEIHLSIDLYSYEFWENFKLVPNLQILQIENWSYRIQSSVHPDILLKILQLPIHALIVEFRSHFGNELNFIHNLITSLKNHPITSLKTLVIIIDKKCPDEIENDFVEKCAKVLKFCSEENMSLKTIQVNLPMKTLGVFDIEHCNLNVKYCFKENGFVSVSMSYS